MNRTNIRIVKVLNALAALGLWALAWLSPLPSVWLNLIVAIVAMLWMVKAFTSVIIEFFVE